MLRQLVFEGKVKEFNQIFLQSLFPLYADMDDYKQIFVIPFYLFPS